MLKALAIVGLVAANSLVNAALPDADKVTALDQWTDISFGLYSGFIDIKDTKKSLHYVAAMSQGDYKTDPVIIWFNGGPGCSSLLGLMQEHGPYVIEDGSTTFTKNDHSWNQ